MTQDIRKLLELAAKACGYSIHDWFDGDSAWAYRIGSELDFYGELSIFRWAPHLDDGDGARMEAKLSITPWWKDSYIRAQHWCREGDQLISLEHDQNYADHNGGRQAARRRASLRVAAEIGRRMKNE